jgi:hypothetical protein
MISETLDELARRLAERGVRGASARRFLDEAREHLVDAATADSETEAVRRFGDLDVIACRVATEVAVTRGRRSTFAAFGVLALVGIAYVAVLALIPAAGGWPDLAGGKVAALGPVTALAIALLPQIAFVSGCLALVAGARLGRGGTTSPAQLGLVRRRNAVALGAGAGTLLALAASAANTGAVLAGWWVTLTILLSFALLIPLVAAAVAVARSSEPRAAGDSPAGDVFDDLGPLFDVRPVRSLELPSHPWLFALLSASVVFVVGVAGGWYAEGDPGSGLVRGAFEAIALVTCFAVLGRTLGLRKARV